jgi:hypothetical protein
MRVFGPKNLDEWCLLSEWTKNSEKSGASRRLTKAKVAGTGRAQLMVQVRTVENHFVAIVQT